MPKFFRIVILLLILATVAQTAWLAKSRATAWEHTLFVGIYPIAADQHETSQRYVGQLKADSFRMIDDFFDEEAKRWGVTVLRPVSIIVAPPLMQLPPPPPRNPNALEAILWSLQMRWWAWRHDAIAGPKPAVRLFVLFHDPERNPMLSHSVGIAQGMLGVVNAFASQEMAGSNAVIITHELLHALGATDKYDPATNFPRFPAGYAEPDKQPALPQSYAEIMGGRMPITSSAAETPRSLDQVLVGPETAREIHWAK